MDSIDYGYQEPEEEEGYCHYPDMPCLYKALDLRNYLVVEELLHLGADPNPG